MEEQECHHSRVKHYLEKKKKILRIHPDVIKNHTGKSAITREENSKGTDFIQTIKGKENLTFLIKAWATELFCLLTWENE